MAKADDEVDFDELDSILEDDDSVKTFRETDDGNVLNWIPTLIPEMDKNLVGGIGVSGQISEIIGKASSGKSTFSALVIKNALKMKVIPVYFDIERTETWVRLEQLGVDPNKVFTVLPKRNSDGSVKAVSIEDVGQKIIDFCAKIHKAREDYSILFVWDSIANSQSEADAEADTHVKSVAAQSKALNIITRKLSANLVANNGGLLAFNQARTDMNAPMPQYASLKTTGGFGWEHALSTRISFKKRKKITKNSTDKEAIGNIIRAQVPKSKIGDNFDSDFELALIGKWGFDIEYNITLDGQNQGLITKNYPKYVSDNGEELKKRNVYEFAVALKDPENFDIKRELWQKLIKIHFPQCYPALFNTLAIMYEDKFPLITGLRSYYINIQEGLPYKDQADNYKLFVDYYKKHKLPEKLQKEFSENKVEIPDLKK